MGWPSDLRRLPNQNVFAIDLPGHGRSKPPACLSLDGLVKHLQDFITCMGFFNVILVGFSLGGALALEYTSRFPKRVRKLTSISCGSRFMIPRGIMQYLRSPVDQNKVIEIFSRAAFHPKVTPAFRKKILSPLYDLDPLVLASDFHIGRIFQAKSSNHQMDTPCLLIGGADDRISPPENIRQLNCFSSHTHIEILPDVDHMVIFEKTKRVRDLLLDFLESKY